MQKLAEWTDRVVRDGRVMYLFIINFRWGGGRRGDCVGKMVYGNLFLILMAFHRGMGGRGGFASIFGRSRSTVGMGFAHIMDNWGLVLTGYLASDTSQLPYLAQAQESDSGKRRHE